LCKYSSQKVSWSNHTLVTIEKTKIPEVDHKPEGR